jgi:hypothetical protein
MPSAQLPKPSEPEVDIAVARLEHLVAEDSTGGELWIGELARAADQLALPTPQLRSIATRLTWISRRRGQPIPDAPGLFMDSGTGGLLLLYVCGQRFRFDFNFRGLLAFLEQYEDSDHAEDALVQSFRVFAKLGARLPDATEDLNHVLQLPDMDTRARHVCLAGIWSAYTIPGQGSLLLKLANRMVELGEADGTVYFRRAAAHRMLRNFQAALDDIDYALSLTAPGNNEINQDYLRERQLIGLAAELSAQQS